MNLLHLLAKQLERQFQTFQRFSDAAVDAALDAMAAAKQRQTLVPSERLRTSGGSGKTSGSEASIALSGPGSDVPGDPKRPNSRRGAALLLLVYATTSLTAAFGQKFYNQPRLDIGTRAPETIQAPADADRIPNPAATKRRRDEARNGSAPVLRIAPEINDRMRQALERLLAQGDELREPLFWANIPGDELSVSTQLYLQTVETSEWAYILQASQLSAQNDNAALILKTVAPQAQSAIQELATYRRFTPKAIASQRLAQIEQSQQAYRQALQHLQQLQIQDPKTVYDAELLRIDEQLWQNTRRGLSLALERLQTQGIAPGLNAVAQGEAIALHVQLAVPLTSQNLGTRILTQILEPNLVQDPEETKRLAAQAAEGVEEVVVPGVRRGDVIVKVGENITEDQLVLLDHFKKSQREPNWRGLGQLGLLVLGEVGLFLLLERYLGLRLRRRDRVLVTLLVLSVPLLILVPELATGSLAAVGLLLGCFYGPVLGTVTIGLIALTLPFGISGLAVTVFAPHVTGGLVAAALAGRMRSREELALTGIGVGLIQGGVHLILNLALSSAAGSLWYTLLLSAGYYALLGLAWCTLAIGLSPYLERLFDLVPPIRLAELANPNRPLLQRLACETPGTFQHTLLVATLAEAAARAVNGNVELIRTGTLYHDIGKMHDPQGFIENQMGGPNKHDLLNDPWKSAEIIKKHVSEGTVMARRHQLPKAVRAFIPEHQGTMLISYFYHQAQQLAAQDPERYQVNEADFRYDGPRPQSRETGIVMLADSCEAALRSLKDATPDEALTMVRKIIRARIQDEQLVDSGLSRDDLLTIAKVFVQIWQQFHHQRIPYPTTTHAPSFLSSRPSP